MQAFQSLARDVETAIASGGGAKRADTLRQLTTLFIEQAPQLGEDHVAVFDQVIARLASEIEFRARVELSARLAEVPNAPRRVIGELARDSAIEVARPVLERSPRLGEAELVEIAGAGGQLHLLAISGRADLTPAVTDVLVTRGDGAVVRKVAANDAARFSDQGFGTLVRRAIEDPALEELLGRRTDLPQHSMKALVTLAAERVRRDMGGRGVAEADLLEAAVAAGAESAARDSICFVLPSDIEAALPGVFAAASRFGEREVAQMLKERRLAEALAGIAYLASLPAETISQAWAAPHYDPLLFLARGLRFGWPTFKLMLEARIGTAPPGALLREAFANFEALTVPTAQRAMRFVVARGRIGPT
ncbi:DUF2336 domain-containing protein [Alsobacter sp. SYSU M60028]|uniref:DUF2336 domain-containing protein n=1 Tax=Alsobacter ponti TaxID=2962936 RepID=A0ABT1LAY6_9HYPH|nr:DUF2336 domain-containing protein [Alsobacter ponti]MCP8938589.1 DUF2336 domain-containing protein [Alsobacter ponti]